MKSQCSVWAVSLVLLNCLACGESTTTSPSARATFVVDARYPVDCAYEFAGLVQHVPKSDGA
jgi:hypothetical protein